MPTTSRIPLCVGSLAVEQHEIRVSGIRWLVPDGHICQPGELLGWCRLGFAPLGRDAHKARPFVSEMSEVQVAFAPRVGGRFFRAPGTSQGGWHDLIPSRACWNAEGAIGYLEAPTCDAGQAHVLRKLCLAARRELFEATDHLFSMLGGFHDRLRGWWADGPGPVRTLLSLGSCEQFGVIRGEQGNFQELFAESNGPAQVVFHGDSAIVPAAPVVLAGMNRTLEEAERIAVDACLALPRVAGEMLPAIGPKLNNWMFAHRVVNALAQSPVTDRTTILGAAGLSETGPAEAVLLSLSSEPRTILRHRKLGYPLWVHPWRFNMAGQPVKTWLTRDFEKIPRSIDEIGRDLGGLVDAIRKRTGAAVIVSNVVSTHGHEDVFTYQGFPAPLSDSVASVRSRELNLMLADLAREKAFAVVDVDALAAELGTNDHVPDGIHASGELQTAIRREVLTKLRDAGLNEFRQPAAPRAALN